MLRPALRMTAAALLATVAVAACSSDGESAPVTTTSTTSELINPNGTHPCDLLTKADVNTIIGGLITEDMESRDEENCVYQITGTTKFGKVSLLGAQVQLGWTEGVSTAEGAQRALGAKPVEGLGTEAWRLGNRLYAVVKNGVLGVTVNGITDVPAKDDQIQRDLVAAALG